jgi:hypothetical protein
MVNGVLILSSRGTRGTAQIQLTVLCIAVWACVLACAGLHFFGAETCLEAATVAGFQLHQLCRSALLPLCCACCQRADAGCMLGSCW